MITITENAKIKIVEILQEETSSAKLRMYVQGGGCSGFQYGFTIDDQTNEDDFQLETDNIPVIVDSMSLSYVSGSIIDYRDDLDGARFIIQNPNASTTCGCGSSFGV
jgi:iron-sulfur cluster insertion protein